MNIKKLFLAWQNPETHCWFPIGILIFDGESYHFTYTNGVKKAQAHSGFKLVHSFPQIERIYHSKQIFPLFSNRLMPTSRPDYPNYIKWLNISENKYNPMDILIRSGGRKVTDTFEIFPYPEKINNGYFQIHFFVHLSYKSQNYIRYLEENTQLFITKDYQNKYDYNALLLKTENNHNLGYLPRYLTKDIIKLLEIDIQSVKVYIEKINLEPAPIQLRLLCNLTTSWNNNFIFFNDQDYLKCE